MILIRMLTFYHPLWQTCKSFVTVFHGRYSILNVNIRYGNINSKLVENRGKPPYKDIINIFIDL